MTFPLQVADMSESVQKLYQCMDPVAVERLVTEVRVDTSCHHIHHFVTIVTLDYLKFMSIELLI